MSALACMWRSLWRFHALLAAILVLEYGLAFAIVLTAAGVLISRFVTVHQASGIVEDGLYIAASRNYASIPPATLRDAMQRYQAVAGAANVALGSAVPFAGTGAVADVTISLPRKPRPSAPLYVNVYFGGMRFAEVLGLRILHGRWFRPDEIIREQGQTSPVVILSAGLAQRLFHDRPAVGQLVEYGGHARTVIGVVNPLAGPGNLSVTRDTATLIVPKLTARTNELLIRYHGPAKKLYAVYEYLLKHNPAKIMWGLYPYGAMRDFYFRSDRRTVNVLAIVVLMVMITALCGILGLTRYWIEQRRRQIAIRRALGASKRAIVVHFLGESGLLVVLGLAVGLVLNFFLSGYFGVVHFEGGVSVWLVSVALVLLVAVIVIYASLRRWLRLDPAALMRVV